MNPHEGSTLRRYWLLPIGVGFAVGAGCTEETPTSGDEDLIPVDPATVEVTLPFSDFADGFEQVGGFGRAYGLGVAIVAHQFEGELESHGLFRFQEYPDQVQVPDPEDPEETITDDEATPVEASVRLTFDPDFVRGEPPYEVVLSKTQEVWDPLTANWDMAVDTLGGREEWSSPGGGDFVEVGRGEWDPEDDDEVTIEVSPDVIDAWEDPDDLSSGLHVSSASEDSHLLVNEAELVLGFESEVNPDTLAPGVVETQDFTTIYDPVPEPEDGMILGGAPAWRSVFDVDIPQSLDGPESLCEQLECPVDLEPGLVVHAELLLHGRQAPAGFSVKDSVRVDAREVLEPERLPRAPIRAITGATRAVGAYDEEGDGEPVAIPLTNYVRALLEYQGQDPEAIGDPEQAPSETLTLLVVPEPFRLDVPAFGAPGQDDEPELRLILTVTDGLRLP